MQRADEGRSQRPLRSRPPPSSRVAFSVWTVATKDEVEERTLRRVGGTEQIKLDMRVIAATNYNIMERTNTGSFREDLFFRLAEYVITVPPLRSRPEDIVYLTRRFLTQARESLGRPPADIAPAALDLLHAYPWPGNVRELRSVVRRTALITSDIVKPEHLAGSLGNGAAPANLLPFATASLRHRVQGQVKAIEHDAVIEALSQAGGNKSKAARLLGILKITVGGQLAPANGGN